MRSSLFAFAWSWSMIFHRFDGGVNCVVKSDEFCILHLAWSRAGIFPRKARIHPQCQHLQPRTNSVTSPWKLTAMIDMLLHQKQMRRDRQKNQLNIFVSEMKATTTKVVIAIGLRHRIHSPVNKHDQHSIRYTHKLKEKKNKRKSDFFFWCFWAPSQCCLCLVFFFLFIYFHLEENAYETLLCVFFFFFVLTMLCVENGNITLVDFDLNVFSKRSRNRIKPNLKWTK